MCSLACGCALLPTASLNISLHLTPNALSFHYHIHTAVRGAGTGHRGTRTGPCGRRRPRPAAPCHAHGAKARIRSMASASCFGVAPGMLATKAPMAHARASASVASSSCRTPGEAGSSGRRERMSEARKESPAPIVSRASTAAAKPLCCDHSPSPSPPATHSAAPFAPRVTQTAAAPVAVASCAAEARSAASSPTAPASRPSMRASSGSSSSLSLMSHAPAAAEAMAGSSTCGGRRLTSKTRRFAAPTTETSVLRVTGARSAREPCTTHRAAATAERRAGSAASTSHAAGSLKVYVASPFGAISHSTKPVSHPPGPSPAPPPPPERGGVVSDWRSDTPTP
mmetsp:Transcript_16133/g.47877  ORF Transcript_16133/g.47877 Transcript_16133/m.47877 type:complete len:340 (-) Transcript_16133:214-1233(-)